jgi:hypothetical protein
MSGLCPAKRCNRARQLGSHTFSWMAELLSLNYFTASGCRLHLTGTWRPIAALGNPSHSSDRQNCPQTESMQSLLGTFTGVRSGDHLPETARQFLCNRADIMIERASRAGRRWPRDHCSVVASCHSALIRCTSWPTHQALLRRDSSDRM